MTPDGYTLWTLMHFLRDAGFDTARVWHDPIRDIYFRCTWEMVPAESRDRVVSVFIDVTGL